MKIVKSAGVVLIVEGNYSASDNTITLTDNVGRSTEQSTVLII